MELEKVQETWLRLPEQCLKELVDPREFRQGGKPGCSRPIRSVAKRKKRESLPTRSAKGVQKSSKCQITWRHRYHQRCRYAFSILQGKQRRRTSV